MMTGPRGELLRRIANLWDGDWSGSIFDGQDGARWIHTALDGDLAALTKLAEQLTEIERSYR